MIFVVLIGISSAFFWGVTDFLAGGAARAVGTFRAALYSQIIGVAVLAAIELGAGGPQANSLSHIAIGWGVVASIASFSGSLCLLQALAVGPASLVAPLVTSYAAVTVILSWAAGEHMAPLSWVGVIVTFLGVICASIPEKNQAAYNSAKAVSFALFAALSHGIGFWLQGTFAIPKLGSLHFLCIFYVTALVLLCLYGIGKKRRFLVSSRYGLSYVAGESVCNLAAYASFAIAASTGQVAIATVLTTLSGVVTAILGVIFRRERLLLRQWVGIMVVVLGVLVIRAS